MFGVLRDDLKFDVFFYICSYSHASCIFFRWVIFLSVCVCILNLLTAAEPEPIFFCQTQPPINYISVTRTLIFYSVHSAFSCRLDHAAMSSATGRSV